MMLQLIAQVTERLDDARNVVLENATLIGALGSSALFAFWVVKKVFKMALYAGIVGAAFWYWYLNIRV